VLARDWLAGTPRLAAILAGDCDCGLVLLLRSPLDSSGARLTPISSMSANSKLVRVSNAARTPADETERLVCQALVDLEANVSELKAELRCVLRMSAALT